MLTDEMKAAIEKILAAHRETQELMRNCVPDNSPQTEHILLKCALIGQLIAQGATDYGPGFFTGLLVYFGPAITKMYLQAYKLTLEYDSGEYAGGSN